MLQNLTGWHAVIILAIVVLIFGATKLPALARSLGQSVRILKDEAADPAKPETTAASADAASTDAQADAVASAPVTTTLAAVPPAPVVQRQTS
ncbi:MAG: hypothetical protein ABS62_02120 [Microbacterium sp. SCN 70-200]|uniref:twin-arginine translocase TatA/TatE family subunit n=1 Tax=unclassified Microbacterium TaxID=2609290 RepID=UPI00086F177E|nr:MULTISPECIES: twin-arginine translocase TatA/TatE family subunit [unclassified Microbacterium]MBN9215289.1 twin-arginine translocase TatA/TatE family subunit [Microbacterium sp.]ODT42692.1 MAG: hypothetical protein ABS62_02120 [Microbacterium sp. SCN 70-200]OJV79965.1 MAG: hypothetical protein BGO46_06910 [Microbacterium sp. 70-16]